MKSIFAISLICCIVLFAISSSYAEMIVQLKSGKILEGDMLEKTDEYVKLIYQDIEVTCWLDEVESIQSGDGVVIFSAEDLSFNEV